MAKRDYTQEHFDAEVLEIEIRNDQKSWNRIISLVPRIKKSLTAGTFHKNDGFLSYSGREMLGAAINEVIMGYVNTNFSVIPYCFTHDVSESILNYLLKEIELENI